MGLQLLQIDRMVSKLALLLPLIAAAAAAPEQRFLCSECVREMHGLAAMVKMGAIPIHDYIRDNYCPLWTPPQLSTSAKTPSPSTTSACSSPLSSTGLLMEPFMFARLRAPATQESTLATSASRAWSGWRLTWKTPS